MNDELERSMARLAVDMVNMGTNGEPYTEMASELIPERMPAEFYRGAFWSLTALTGVSEEGEMPNRLGEIVYALAQRAAELWNK